MGYSGKIYDIDETKRIQERLAEQDKLFASIEKEKKIGDTSLVRYVVIGAGVILLIVVFSKFIKK
jgi:hypothetical protein